MVLVQPLSLSTTTPFSPFHPSLFPYLYHNYNTQYAVIELSVNILYYMSVFVCVCLCVCVHVSVCACVCVCVYFFF